MSLNPVGYVDLDYAGYKDTRRSTEGNIFIVVVKRLFTLGVFLFSFFKWKFPNYCLSSSEDKSLNKIKICDLLRKAP